MSAGTSGGMGVLGIADCHLHIIDPRRFAFVPGVGYTLLRRKPPALHMLDARFAAEAAGAQSTGAQSTGETGHHG